MIQKIYEENGFLVRESVSSCIFNCDESGFNINPTQKKIFFKKSAKDAYLIIIGKIIEYSVISLNIQWFL